MKKRIVLHRLFIIIAFIVFFCDICIAQSDSNENTKETDRPRISIDRGGELPAPSVAVMLNEKGQLADTEEAMFATYSFNDANTTYNIEFYFRERYNRLRARVLVGNHEVKGLFNRFYEIDPKRTGIFSVYTTKTGPFILQLDSFRLCT